VQRLPLIWFIDRIATDRRVMGDARSGWLSRTALVITFIDRIVTDRPVMGDARGGWLARTALVITFIGYRLGCGPGDLLPQGLTDRARAAAAQRTSLARWAASGRLWTAPVLPAMRR